MKVFILFFIYIFSFIIADEPQVKKLNFKDFSSLDNDDQMLLKIQNSLEQKY